MPDDLDKLQGTWNISAFELDGEPMPTPPGGGSRVVVKGDHFTSIGMGAPYEGTLTIDEAKRPKHFDLLFTVGHAAGTRNLGIYELAGDRWTICLATRGARPKKFATKPGTGLALEVLERREGTRTAVPGRRTKQHPKQPARAGSSRAKAGESNDAAPRGPATALEGEWTMVAAVFNGVPMAADMVKWCKRITRGDVTTVLAGPQVMLSARFTLDDPQHPHDVDYVNLEGSAKGESQSGIVELTGESLKICMSAPGKGRPSDYSSAKGDGRAFTTWRLVKK
ncbi:MAG: TIGR03067 domain-containing protein [Gemmatimonadales bacterium]